MATKKKVTKKKATKKTTKKTAKTEKPVDNTATIESAEDQDPVAVIGLDTVSLSKPQKPAPPVESGLSGAALWEKIKDLPIDIFALPNQTVSDHVQRKEELEKAMPEALHLTLRSNAVLPALEDALNKIRLGPRECFDISETAGYTVIKVVPKAY